MDRKKSLVIGPRTRKDILKGRNIGKHEYGGDIFEDYWTDSDDESSTCSKISDSSSKLHKKALNVDSASAVEIENEEDVTVNLGICNENKSPSKRISRVSSRHPQTRGIDKTRSLHSPIRHKESSNAYEITDVSPSPKMFGKKREILGSPKRTLRNTHDRGSPKTLDEKGEIPGTPKRTLRNTDDPQSPKTLDEKKGVSGTPKRTSRSTDDSPSYKTFGKKGEMPGTPKRTLRNTDGPRSPKKALDENREMPGTPKRTLRNTDDPRSPKTLGEKIDVPGTPKRTLRSTRETQSPKTLGEKVDVPGTPKRAIRNTDDPRFSKTLDEKGEMPGTPKRTSRSTDSSSPKTFAKNAESPETPKRSLKSTTKNLIQDDEIHVLSKSKILSFDMPNVAEMPPTPKRILRNNSKEINTLSKANILNSDTPDTSNAAELDAVASVLSKTFNKNKEMPAALKRNLNTSKDNDIDMPKTKNVINDPPTLSKSNYIKKNSLLPRRVSEIRKQNSKKSITITKTNRPAEIKEILSHYDEYDARIMQMIHSKDSEPHEGIPNSQNFDKKRSPNPELSTVDKIHTKRTSKTSKKIHEENISDEKEHEDGNKSPRNRNKIFTESVNKNNKDLESHPENGRPDKEIDTGNVDDVTSSISPHKQSFVKNRTALSSVKNVSSSSENTYKKTDKTRAKILSEFRSTGKIRKAKIIENDNRYNGQNNQVSTNKNTLSKKNIPSASGKENMPKERVNEISPRSSHLNDSASFFENSIDVSKISRSKTKRRKTIAKNRDRPAQDDENDSDNDSLKAIDSFEESASSDMTEDNLSGQKQRKKKSVKSSKFDSINRLHRLTQQLIAVENEIDSSEDINEKTKGDKMKRKLKHKSTGKKHKTKVVVNDSSDSGDHQIDDFSLSRTTQRKSVASLKATAVPDESASSGLSEDDDLVQNEKLNRKKFSKSKKNSPASNKNISSYVEEAVNPEESDNEIPPQSSQMNTSVNSSKRSNEDAAEITEVDNTNVSKTNKRRKTIDKKNTGTVEDENYLDEQRSLKGTASEKSASSGVSKNNLSMRNQKHKKNKSAKSNRTKRANEVRRSTRQRYAPLARWRNERLLYRYENGEIKVLGIDKGTKEDDGHVKGLYNKMQSRTVSEEAKKKPKKAQLIDPVQKKKMSIVLHTKFSRTPWDTPVNAAIDETSQHSYLIKRMIETNKNAFGFLQIRSGKEKPPQYMPEEDLQLTVLRGELEIAVQKNIYRLTNNDMFIVPRGSAYSVKNVGKNRALLSFVVGRFKFLESI